MGRIDEALRRANLDAAQGTGADTTAPAASPWPVERHEESDGPGPVAPSPVEAAAGAPAGGPVRGTDGPSAPWDGANAEAVERLVGSKSLTPLVVEQYRRLAATLLRAQGERPLKSVIVTSPSPGDGKSHVAANLALTLSESFGRRVLLIDADLRRPTLHLLLRVPNARGLSDTLNEKVDEKVSAVQISETLTLLSAGRAAHNPLSGLSSDRLKRIVADAASRFDWVLVDSPPVGVLADAHLVSEAVDAAILVVRAGVTRYPDLEASADILGRERILGIVLNAVEADEIRGEGYYGYYAGGGRGRD